MVFYVYWMLNVWFNLYLIFLLIRAYVKLTSVRCQSHVSLVGKTAIVTGGNQGLGHETALSLASRGCKVIIADIKDGEEIVEKMRNQTNNPNIFYKYINLSNFESVRMFVNDIKSSEKYLHILINNAGRIKFGKKIGAHGIHEGMTTNYFGAFLLTYLLVDLLKKSGSSRIVFVSSKLAFFHKLNMETLVMPTGKTIVKLDFNLYNNSKMATIIAADWFAKKLRGSGVVCNSAHPGLVNTGLFSRMTISTFSDLLRQFVLYVFAKNVNEGAQTIVHCATAKEVENISGEFFAECKPTRKPILANDRHFCDKMCEKSVELVQIRPDEQF